MGMFDSIRCFYVLPIKDLDENLFQTKSLDNALDNYEIRDDGTLWYQNYDVEDHSDPNADGVKRLIGMITRVNKKWEFKEDFTGEIRFYTCVDDVRWVEFSAYFVKGVLKELFLTKDEFLER